MPLVIQMLGWYMPEMELVLTCSLAQLLIFICLHECSVNRVVLLTSQFVVCIWAS